LNFLGTSLNTRRDGFVSQTTRSSATHALRPAALAHI